MYVQCTPQCGNWQVDMIEVCQTDVVCGGDMTCQLIQTDERGVHDVSFHQQADEATVVTGNNIQCLANYGIIWLMGCQNFHKGLA